jgi:hypothetical protein
MFGGMPTYQIWYEHTTNVTTYVGRMLRTVFPQPADAILLLLLGSYFLFSALRVRPWLAAVGAIAITFSSYNFIYVEAGHLNRVYAIAYMAPVIGALLLTYRGHRLWGAVLLALFLALEIRANHVQTTYYLFIAAVLLVGFELYHAIKDKKLPDFLKSTGFQVGAAVLAVAINATVLFPTYEYSQLTTRGKANIVSDDGGSNGKDTGLDKSYIYDWSQGIGENITFLIPNAYGGGMSTKLDETSNVAKILTNQGFAPQAAANMPTYWGEKPFTSGPWYFGAGVFFLFVVGLVIVRDRLKYWVIAAGVLTLLLAFGKHFPLVSDLFLEYLPLYNKFRAVESILVVVSILIPMLAVLAVQELLERGKEIPNLDKKLLYSFIGVAGFCLLVALVPSLFLSFKASNHQELVAALSQQIGDKNVANQLVNALVKDRSALASADAWRSLLIVAITFGLVWLFIKQKASAIVLVVGLGVVILADLWSVDKRYLNDTTFVDKHASRNPIPEREVDQLIRMDKDPSYRVLDLTVNPFSDTKASYFHKSLGGYHAAKLMRFQEILEHQFSGAINEDVLDMFNVRYVITQDPNNGSERIQRRSTAAGNAWFVDRVTFVKDNRQEMDAISSFDPQKEAFVHEEFKGQLDTKRLGRATNASISLTSYHPDRMKYEYSAPNDVFAVFSEVYYDKGWKAYVDGEELPIIRADYILRGLQLPGGNHTVEFVFDPQTMKVSNTVSLISSIILIGGLLGIIVLSFRRREKKA